MRRFFIRLLIFVLPFFLAASATFLFAWSFGEARPQAWFATVPYSAAWVYFPSWQREDIANFKLETSLLRQPEVLIIGSSRSLEIAPQIFNLEPNAVYNAGIDGASIGENAQLVSLLAAQNKMPQLLIIQLDYPDYNGDSVTFRNREIDLSLPSFAADWNQVKSGLVQVGRELFTNPNLFFQPHPEYGAEYRFFGLSALETGIGYLPDGRQYNPHLSAEVIEATVLDQTDDFNRRRRQYEIGQNLSSVDMAVLRSILEAAQTHNTQVLAYFPPYRQSIYEPMMDSSDFAYIQALQTSMNALFQEYHYRLFDFSDIQTVGGNDEELYDTWHAGQVLNMRLFHVMSENAPELLGAYIDSNQLSEAIANAENPFYVFFP